MGMMGGSNTAWKRLVQPLIKTLASLNSCNQRGLEVMRLWTLFVVVPTHINWLLREAMNVEAGSNWVGETTLTPLAAHTGTLHKASLSFTPQNSLPMCSWRLRKMLTIMALTTASSMLQTYGPYKPSIWQRRKPYTKAYTSFSLLLFLSPFCLNGLDRFSRNQKVSKEDVMIRRAWPNVTLKYGPWSRHHHRRPPQARMLRNGLLMVKSKRGKGGILPGLMGGLTREEDP